jgi:hypothetical protein
MAAVLPDCGVSELAQLYEQDYSAWAEAHVALLKAGRFESVDVAHLIAELEDMGQSERRRLESHLRVLLAHLLKWQFQYAQLAERWQEFDGRSWRNTIVHQRTQLQLLLHKHPGMKRLWLTAKQEAYADARVLAAKETGLSIENFPEICPYCDAEIVEQDDYLPPCQSFSSKARH